MTETDQTGVRIDGTEPAVHDHAWRRVSSDEDSPGRLGVYRCDLCATAWSMWSTG